MVEIIVTTERISSDPAGRQLIEYVNEHEAPLKLTSSILYYDFPSYSDYEAEVHRPDFLLLTRSKGAIAIRSAEAQGVFRDDTSLGWALDASISEFASLLIGRLLKSRILRAQRGKLRFEVLPVLFVPGYEAPPPEGLESAFVNSYDALYRLLDGLEGYVLSEDEFSEARSIIEGAKALTRVQRRVVEDPGRETKAAALAALESEIANFDQRQRQTALSTVPGPQRIRGLAGSGKTVILAMKAAHLHMTHPQTRILVTFYTKSLQTGRVAKLVEIERCGLRRGMVGRVRRRGQGRWVSAPGSASHRPGAW